MSNKKLVYLSFIFFTLFLWLTIQVDTRSYFAWDYRLIDFIKSFTSPFTKSILTTISWPGYSPQVFYIIGATLLFLLFRSKKIEAILSLFSFSSISLIVYLIKIYIGRFRPDAHIYIYSGADRSFPSGHMVSYTVIIGFFLYLLHQKYKSKAVRFFLLFIYSLTMFLTGVSRVYLGFHWPTDVMGGFFLGLSWLLLTIVMHKVFSPT